jgi:TPR repeat protein
VLPTEPDQHADSSAKSGNLPAEEKPNTRVAEGSTTRSAEETEKAAATPPPPVNPRKSHTTKLEPAHTRAKSASVETASLATSPDADLELAGEKYLYGSGLPQNCARAESSLRTAAMHGNSKAETVLGTMYATGHCVGRDLPTAYRWFARALHQEPQNSRISADLQVLWRQMTPQEQQLATTSKQ